MVLAVNQTLGRTSRIDTGRPGTGNAEIETGTFPASHGKHHGARPDTYHAMFRVAADNAALLKNTEHHTVRHQFHTGRPGIFHKPARILRSGQFLIKVGKSEPGMDTLLEDSSR